MSSAALLNVTTHDLETAETDATEAPLANGEALPRPRSSTAATTAAFVLLAPGSALVAYLFCLSAMYAMSYSTTIGAWMMVGLFALWAPMALGAVLVAQGRGEWSS